MASADFWAYQTAKDRHSPPKSGDECGLARRYPPEKITLAKKEISV
jgi:hypothetical protein